MEDSGLTERQIEVMECLVSGYTQKEIAEELGIGFNTVNTHLNHIRARTNTKNNTQAVFVAMRRKWFPCACGGDQIVE